MLKRMIAVAAAASLSLLGAAGAAQAQAQAPARPAAHLPGVKVLNLHRAFEARLGHAKAGTIAGIAYARGHRPRAAAKAAASCTEPACPVAWQGGPVQHTPHVYLLLWGPNWESDPGQEASAAYLESFLSGLGDGQADDNWSTITSQYADGTGAPGFSGLVYEGAFDDTNVPPSDTSLDQLGAEADSFAATQGITDLNDAQIIVATQSGTCPQGFQGTSCTGGTRDNCGYHGFSNEPFINLPYLPDADPNCGDDAVNPAPAGNNDGWSIIGGALYADTITDPSGTGWLDPGNGMEIGDKCSAAFDLTLTPAPGSFAVQTLWSNAAGGCVRSYAVHDAVKITSPGPQATTVGKSVSLAVAGNSTAGNPLSWSANGLPATLTIGSSTGVIAGTVTASPADYSVTVKATDKTGAAHSVSFGWTVNAVTGKAIKGDHGKCLDDSGGGTTNGNKVDIWSCNNTGSQKWTFTGGQLSVLGKCLDDPSQGGAGAKLAIWTCNGNKAQTWTHRSNGEYVLKLNGLCLTDPSGSSVNGTQVVIHVCNNFADQHWSVP